jgi:transcriptional regulator with XRE-family HTH domain
MALESIHKGKQPRRPHHIAEWAEARNLSQADIAREIGADKSVVSRWFNGTTPGLEWQVRLADLFHTEPESLFRHPDEDWLARFFADRKKEEVDRIKQMLELSFPKRTGTTG